MKYSAYVELDAAKYGGNITKECFMDIYFVSNAVSTDETRAMMWFIHVKKLDEVFAFVSTDGRRMHVAEIPCFLVGKLGITEGNWKVVRKTKTFMSLAKEERSEYPDWQKIMNQQQYDASGVFYGIKSGKMENRGSIEVYSLFKTINKPIQITFLQDMGVGPWKYNYHQSGESKPVLFSLDNKKVYVMPLQSEDRKEEHYYRI